MTLENATSQHLRQALAALCLGASASVFAAPSHQHGVAQLDIGVDPGRVTLLLEMPLDSLVGFERAPRNDDERRQVEAALATLRDLASLVRTDPAAQCTPGGVSLQSAALGLGTAPSAAPAAKEGHADIEATAEFICKDGGKAGFVEIGLFDAFPRLQRVDVQTATRRGQMKATLKRPERRVPLAR
jgi:hypothetical protein